MGDLLVYGAAGALTIELLDFFRAYRSGTDPDGEGRQELPPARPLLFGALIRVGVAFGAIIGGEAMGFVCNDQTAFVVGLSAPVIIERLAAVGEVVGDA